MSDDYREILFRKFERISDPPPEAEQDTIEKLLKTAVSEARRILETIEKNAQPYSSEARTALGQAAAHIEQVASKSSTEARTFLAGFLEEVAKRIKP
jgi:vacuolar-type H+-ATPase subunit H